MPSISTTNTHQAATPSFPSEVWLAIFEWATFVPNAFDTHAPDPSIYPAMWSQEQIQEDLNRTVLMKCDLVRVCKCWNLLATRLLYRSIVLTSPATVEKVLETIANSYENNVIGDVADISTLEASGRSLGQWTKRLDIVFTSFDDAFPCEDFKALIRCLPNLEIFVLRESELRVQGFLDFSPPRAPPCLTCISSMIGNTLRVLDLSFKNIHVDNMTTLSEIVNAHSLRRLVINHGNFPFRLEQTRAQIRTPQVECLDVPVWLLGSILHGQNTVKSTSSLSYLAIDGDCYSNPLVKSILEENLSIFGAHLLTLEIRVDRPDFSFPNQKSLTTLLRRATIACPCLHNLIIDFQIPLDSSHLPIDSLPQTAFVGLRLHRKDQWSDLNKVLQGLIHQSPHTKVIRILNKTSDYRFHHIYKYSSDALRKTSYSLLSEHRIRFEDYTGRLFFEVPDDQLKSMPPM